MSSVNMPPTRLPAVTAEGLQRVARRRMTLLVARGLAVLMVVFAAACLAAALADRTLLLSETVRWWLAAGFVVTLVVAGVIAALPCLQRFGKAAVARLVEAAVPTLKNRLLAAVELAGEQERPSLGSPAFRDSLQQLVAGEMRGLNAKAILPWRRVQGPLVVALCVVLVVGGLFATPSLALPQHLLRVLFPSANIARPSIADLRFRSPASPDAIVPLAERLAVTLDLTLPPTAAFGAPETVRLEIESLDGDTGGQVIELLQEPRKSDDESASLLTTTYQAQWLVNTPRQRYRAISPVGETPWFVLEAAARPQVDEVEIVVTPPPYAGVDPITTVNERGDVAAVIGSTVRWIISPSTPLKSAELVWLDAAADPQEPMRAALSEAADGRWSLDTPVSITRRLQFDLVSGVGMPSLFTPTARLTAVEDEPPQIVWQQPEMQEATVPAVSSHLLELEITDEFPLTSLEQWTRINRGAWTTVACDFDSTAAEQSVVVRWDLERLELVPGDLVETKLVAVDRRGLQGESPTLEWAISESLLQLSAVPRDPARREIAKQIASLAAETEEVLADAVLEQLTPKDGHAPEPEQLQTTAADLRAAADRLEQQAAAIRETIHEALRDTDASLTSDELAVTAAALSRQETEDADALRLAAETLEQSLQLPEDEAAAQQTTAVQQAKRVRQNTERLDRRFRSLASQDVLDEAASRLDAAARFQEELVNRSDMLGSETYAREQQLLAVHMRAMALTLERDTALLSGGAVRQAMNRKQWAEEMADRLEEAAGKPVPAEDEEARSRAQTAAAELLAQLEANRSVHGISPGLSGETRQARRELRQLAGTAAEVVSRAAKQLKNSTENAASDGEDPAETLEQLRHRRTALLAEAGPQQAYAAADLGAAYRGLTDTLSDVTVDSEAASQTFTDTSKAVQTLEAAGRLATAMSWVDQMLESERDAGDRVTAHTATPRVWEATSQELEDASNAIRQAGLPAEVADQVRAARWSPAAEEVGRKVSPRQWDVSQTVSAAADLETLRGNLQQQFDALQGPIAAARATLEGFAPSIPDLARQAAERAAQQHEAAEQLAAEEAAGESTDLDAVLPDEAPQDNELIDRLQSALVDAAATQDLLDAAERERARDADLARELVSASQQRVEEATAEARQQQGQDQGKALAELSNAFEEAENTFDMIADHFDRDPLAANTSSQQAGSESLAEAAARQSPAAAAELEQAYEQAERLGEVAETAPEDLLRRLEEELQTNLPMREALSDIAGGLAEQSQQALEFAAERERTLRHDVESSDATVREEKRQFSAELRLIGEQTARVAQRLGQEAQRQAEAAGLPERQEQLAGMAKQLEEAVEAVRSVPDTASVPELFEAASRLDQAIDTAAPGLREASEALSTATAQRRELTEDQERRALSDATVASGRWHQQDVRWADQDLRTRERRIQEADRLVQDAGRQLEQARAQEDKARQQQSQDPDSESRREQLQRTEVRRQEAEALTSLAADIRQREERRLEQARATREEAGQQPAVLDAANPQAQLAERLTSEAAARANQLSDQLGTMLSEAGWQQQLEGSQGQLESSARQQETVTASVADAADSLERAAAHEMRLGGFATAGQLADAAQRVEATSRQEPASAGTSLAEAAASSEATSPAARASQQASQAAVDAVSRAGEAIAQRADELARLLSPTADSDDGTNSREGSSGESGEASSSSGSGNQLLEPAEMARMLDQLDREMRQSQPGSPTQPGQSGEPSAARRALQRSQSQLARGLQQQRGEPGSPTSQQQNPSMMDAQATPSMATQSGSGMLQEAATADQVGDVRLLEADGRDVFIGGWNTLRQQQAGEVVESLRTTISPRYRRQVENYFRVLSERGQSEGGQQ
jgi:hypothetical protein